MISMVLKNNGKMKISSLCQMGKHACGSFHISSSNKKAKSVRYWPNFISEDLFHTSGQLHCKVTSSKQQIYLDATFVASSVSSCILFLLNSSGTFTKFQKEAYLSFPACPRQIYGGEYCLQVILVFLLQNQSRGPVTREGATTAEPV